MQNQALAHFADLFIVTFFSFLLLVVPQVIEQIA